MFSKTYSATLIGTEGEIIEVETGLLPGLHSFQIVGLPHKSVKEAKERISLAIHRSQAKSPLKFNKKIIINLAPADIPKEGSQFDLAIALSFLSASGQIKKLPSSAVFIGELGLNGEVKKIFGALPIVLSAQSLNFEEIYLPSENLKEVSFVEGIKIFPVNSLIQLINHLEEKELIKPIIPHWPEYQKLKNAQEFSYIKGQLLAKRALAISAGGGHNILLSGPPGTGKTLLAKNLIALLPPLCQEEAIEVAKVYSAVGLERDNFFQPPFRAPHHSASAVAILGGGQNPQPGEISLAHRGVLFLDEMPEFSRDILEGLREPIENGKIVISRAKGKITFPAKFILVGAKNPCPCGYYADPEKECKCTLAEIRKYHKKISGPLLDRIDIFIDIFRPEADELFEKVDDFNLEKVKEKIQQAKEIQLKRYKDLKIFQNSELSLKEIQKFCSLKEKEEAFLKEAIKSLNFSPRAIHRVLKIARTIADLENKENIEINHLAEAIQYRAKENEN